MKEKLEKDTYEKLDEINQNLVNQFRYQKNKDHKERMDNRKVNIAILLSILILIIISLAFPSVSDSKIGVLIASLAFFISVFKAILKW